MLDKLMVTHPGTGEKDVILSLVVFIVMICGFRFLLDGVTITVLGKTIACGHVDPMGYAALLGPMLGAHSYIDTKKNSSKVVGNDSNDDKN